MLGAALLATLGVVLALKLLGPRSANAPSGIAGARLGWSEQTLRDAVPGLEAGAGPSELRARVLLFDEPATCSYLLGKRGTLDSIDCVLDAAPSTEAHERTAERLSVVLRQLYGAESLTKPGYHEWQNREARLVLRTNDPVAGAPVSIRVVDTALQPGGPAR